MPPETDPSLAHLQAELARIDARVQREVRRWQLAGQDIHDEFRGLKVSDAEADALLSRPFATSWGQTTDLGPDAERYAAAEAHAEAEARALAARAKGSDALRLRRLAAVFGLDRFDLDVFLVCLAPSLDLRYERLYGFLQDDITRRRPTVDLVLNLLCGPGPQRLLKLARFAGDAPLMRFGLLEWAPEPGHEGASLLNRALAVDAALVGWLLGEQQMPAALAGSVSILQPGQSAADSVLAGERWPELQQALASQPGHPPVVVLHGPDQASQQAVLRLLASSLKRPLLLVDLARAASAASAASGASAERPWLDAVRLALREARLNNAVACLMGWDAALAAGPAAYAAALGEILSHPDLAVIGGQAAWQAQGLARSRNLVWLEFPIPDYAHRLAMWRHLLSEAHANGGGKAQALSPQETEALAGQFVLTATQIRDAVASAIDWAAQRGETAAAPDLFRAARIHSSPGLSNLAHKIEPRFTWDDIVLPDDQVAMLHEIIATVRGRPTVLETWGLADKLASSRGVTVLFAGPPGTGKTMAAEVVAARLRLDLYKIDLSTVVNKYIGETEKNLGRIFDEASNSNAILFFDEADAIFGKRSEVKDAHDRYANIEVSYLLQRMESYDGVTVLATNLRANLDDAFTRRLHFAIDFPFPDEIYRLRIWQALFPPELPRANDIDLPLLARRYKLAGGNIRNIIVSAAFLAAGDGGQVTMPHLLHGARRELQKMGRLVKDGEAKFSVGRA